MERGCTGARRAKVPGKTYHTYVASRGWLLYTPSVELVVGWRVREIFRYEFFCHSLIMSCSCEQRCQALPGFYVLQAMKSWAGPGNEATNTVDPQLSKCLVCGSKITAQTWKTMCAQTFNSSCMHNLGSCTYNLSSSCMFTYMLTYIQLELQVSCKDSLGPIANISVIWDFQLHDVT